MIGHVSPEAADGGPIALVEEGDLIRIDICGRSLSIIGAKMCIRDRGILSGPAGQMTVTVIWGAMLAGRVCIAFVFPVKNSFRTLSLMSACCVGTYILLLMAKTPASALICLFLFGLAIAGVNPTAVAAGNALSRDVYKRQPDTRRARR